MMDNPYKDFIGSAQRYANYEYRLTVDCILPMMARWGIGVKGKRVMDVGCGSGGALVALAEFGADCLGIDREKHQIDAGRELALQQGVKIRFLVVDALEAKPIAEMFDLIILSEVVEHFVTLANVTVVLRWCLEHLRKGGSIYVSFPPWLNPFAGHQAGWPVIRYIPWYHFMPDSIKKLLAPKHATRYIDFAKELNRLTIKSFEESVQQSRLNIVQREFYHLRPEYHLRYGVPVIRSFKWFAENRVLREFSTTGAYYLLSEYNGPDGFAAAPGLDR